MKLLAVLWLIFRGGSDDAYRYLRTRLIHTMRALRVPVDRLIGDDAYEAAAALARVPTAVREAARDHIELTEASWADRARRVSVGRRRRGSDDGEWDGGESWYEVPLQLSGLAQRGVTMDDVAALDELVVARPPGEFCEKPETPPPASPTTAVPHH